MLSEETVAIEVERRLRELAAERPQTAAFLIQRPPARGGAAGGRARGRPARSRSRPRPASHFHFEGSEALPIDHFAVVLEGTPRGGRGARAARSARARRCSCTIEEPHMYTEDDAVAKLDGYVISVAGAATLVGEKTLVRIEKVGRSRRPGVAGEPAARAVARPRTPRTVAEDGNGRPAAPARTARRARAAQEGGVALVGAYCRLGPGRPAAGLALRQSSPWVKCPSHLTGTRCRHRPGGGAGVAVCFDASRGVRRAAGRSHP